MYFRLQMENSKKHSKKKKIRKYYCQNNILAFLFQQQSTI